MKKLVWAAFVMMALSLASLPLAAAEVNRGKNEIMITEKVLFGDPAAAAGITLEIMSHWDNHLFWDTVYTIGSGERAESVFSFSGERAGWSREEEMDAYACSVAGAGFGSAYTVADDGFGSAHTYMDTPVWPEDFPFPEMVRAVADRTNPGETHTETVRISDYVQNYPMDFGLVGSSVEYVGDTNETMEFLTELFHISTEGDRIELTAEKNEEGILIGIRGQMTAEREAFRMREASAFGDGGCYYAYNCENPVFGEAADRGQNRGIFYLPFQREDDLLAVEIPRMRKVCELPGEVFPEGMILDDGGHFLYLAARGEGGHYLYIYGLEGEIPVLEQEILIRGSGSCERIAESVRPQNRNDDLGVIPELRRIRMVEGGLLITWDDNGFAFAAETDGQWRLWCDGTFPGFEEQEYGVDREQPFPGEQECVFDGERLVLAAFEAWESLDVVIAVYGRQGESYCGRYIYSGGVEPDRGRPYRGQLLPVGQEHGRLLVARYSGQLYFNGTGTPVEPLKMWLGGGSGDGL